MQVLSGSKRMDAKHSQVTQLRHNGQIPAVVYGKQMAPTPIAVNEADLSKIIRGNHQHEIIQLTVDNQPVQTILKAHQIHKVSRKWIHADFQAVDDTTETTIDIRVSLIGEAQGVRDGGVLTQSFHEVPVVGKPAEIPAEIRYDITNLHVTDVVTVGDLCKQNNIKIHLDPEQIICSILPPRQEEEINTGEQQDGGVPDREEGLETPASPASEME